MRAPEKQIPGTVSRQLPGMFFTQDSMSDTFFQYAASIPTKNFYSIFISGIETSCYTNIQNN